METGILLKSLGCKATIPVTDRFLVELGGTQPVVSSLAASRNEYSMCNEATEIAEPLSPT